jgi:UDP-N-acetylglucosamine pyrophosphorylase
MRAAGQTEAALRGFLGAVARVRRGERGFLPESAIDPVESLPRLEALQSAQTAVSDESLLRELVVFKLNGGLGTGMGLDGPKSLVPVRDGATFLDFILQQIGHLRNRTWTDVPAFCLMNSSATQRQTREFLSQRPELGDPASLEFLQSAVPKLNPTTLEPVSWPADPEMEWCPPGHGDFYPSLFSCGLLDRLLARGIRYAFVSNSDNLGATVDAALLRYFAEGGFPFLMEVAERTAADRKGGHLARSRTAERLLLRESAQCPKEDEAAFQDIARHRFFNTNNLWIRLDAVRDALVAQGGTLALPLITNVKTVDPRDAKSPKVLQLESAMGAAIGEFDGATAVVVPRSRFAPVKATADLLALRSDVYRVTEDHRLVLIESRAGQPPVVDLDGEHYKLLSDFETLFPGGVPSLRECESLQVRGRVEFRPGVICRGKVEFVRASAGVGIVEPGVYVNQRVEV